jgi:hypothetical protein
MSRALVRPPRSARAQFGRRRNHRFANEELDDIQQLLNAVEQRLGPLSEMTLLPQSLNDIVWSLREVTSATGHLIRVVRVPHA